MEHSLPPPPSPSFSRSLLRGDILFCPSSDGVSSIFAVDANFLEPLFTLSTAPHHEKNSRCCFLPLSGDESFLTSSSSFDDDDYGVDDCLLAVGEACTSYSLPPSTILLYLASRHQLGPLSILSGHRGHIWGISPLGRKKGQSSRRIVSCSASSDILVHDVSSGENLGELQEFFEVPRVVRCFPSISPCDVFVGGSTPPGVHLRRYDAEKRMTVRTMLGHKGSVSCLACLGRRGIVLSGGSVVRMWDGRTNRSLGSIEFGGGGGGGMNMSRQGFFGCRSMCVVDEDNSSLGHGMLVVGGGFDSISIFDFRKAGSAVFRCGVANPSGNTSRWNFSFHSVFRLSGGASPPGLRFVGASKNSAVVFGEAEEGTEDEAEAEKRTAMVVLKKELLPSDKIASGCCLVPFADPGRYGARMVEMEERVGFLMGLSSSLMHGEEDEDAVIMVVRIGFCSSSLASLLGLKSLCFLNTD